MGHSGALLSPSDLFRERGRNQRFCVPSLTDPAAGSSRPGGVAPAGRQFAPGLTALGKLISPFQRLLNPRSGNKAPLTAQVICSESEAQTGGSLALLSRTRQPGLPGQRAGHRRAGRRCCSHGPDSRLQPARERGTAFRFAQRFSRTRQPAPAGSAGGSLSGQRRRRTGRGTGAGGAAAFPPLLRRRRVTLGPGAASCMAERAGAAARMDWRRGNGSGTEGRLVLAWGARGLATGCSLDTFCQYRKCHPPGGPGSGAVTFDALALLSRT